MTDKVFAFQHYRFLLLSTKIHRLFQQSTSRESTTSGLPSPSILSQTTRCTTSTVCYCFSACKERLLVLKYNTLLNKSLSEHIHRAMPFLLKYVSAAGSLKLNLNNKQVFPKVFNYIHLLNTSLSYGKVLSGNSIQS